MGNRISSWCHLVVCCANLLRSSCLSKSAVGWDARHLRGTKFWPSLSYAEEMLCAESTLSSTPYFRWITLRVNPGVNISYDSKSLRDSFAIYYMKAVLAARALGGGHAIISVKFDASQDIQWQLQETP